MKEQDIKKLKAYAITTNNTDRFVILKEDEQGRYIEYAFQPCAPHDNRCLSWYDKLQPNALIRNNHDIETWKKKLHEVGEIYELQMFSCGHQNDEPESETHCSPGHPCKKCADSHAAKWTYDKPVKCACWCLVPINDINDYKMTINEATVFAKVLNENNQN